MLKTTFKIFVIAFAAMFAGGGVAFGADEPCYEPKAECLEYVREAAERGDAEAQYNLGVMYDIGKGVTADDYEAVRWYRAAAEQGHTEAQIDLGLMYYTGAGVAKDKSKAVHWLRLAAKRGNVVAQSTLGSLYYTGEGVAKDYRESARWTRLAAEQGYAAAQYNLGWKYNLGVGVDKDKSEAYIWFSLAKAGGHEKADKLLRDTDWQQYLTSTNIQSAKREMVRRSEAIKNKKNDAQSSDNNSVQKGDGEFAVAKPPKLTNIAAKVFENTWRSVVMIKNSAGSGSGVIIRPNLVATNCHVVNGGGIVVYKPENKRIDEKTFFSAKIVHRNEVHDFCIIEVKGLWGIPATIRKYDTLKVGESVYALGAPLGLDMSLSEGVISQLRKIDKVSYIQTDAAISPGSSGGGLFDVGGNFVGMPTQKYADKAAEGLGFAIPADLALEF